MAETHERVVAVRKSDAAIKAGQKLRFDRPNKVARAESNDTPDEMPLFGVAASDAGKGDFTVDARIPVAQPGDLVVVQTLTTGRVTADDRPIVEPVIVHRRFRKQDDPSRDRHPVEHLLQRDAAQAKSAAKTK